MWNTKKIRREVYDFIESKGIKLSSEDRAFLHEEFFKHAKELEIESREKITNRGEVIEKITKYITKAKTLPQNSTVKVQVETLKLIRSWLVPNQD